MDIESHVANCKKEFCNIFNKWRSFAYSVQLSSSQISNLGSKNIERNQQDSYQHDGAYHEEVTVG